TKSRNLSKPSRTPFLASRGACPRGLDPAEDRRDKPGGSPAKGMIMKRIVHSLFFVLAFAPAAVAQPMVAPPEKYAAAVAHVEKLVRQELADKKLPAISVAIVEDQTVVWAKGFGYADPEKKVSATAQTLYRVGSVSKLFTDIAVMQLVEQK